MGKKVHTVTMTNGEASVVVNDDEQSMAIWKDAGYSVAEQEAVAEPPADPSSSDDSSSADGDDPIAAMSGDDLRAAIKERTGRNPAKSMSEDELRDQYRMIQEA